MSVHLRSSGALLIRRVRQTRAALLLIASLALPGCTTIGSLMSPYPEKFACKNDDHGQCIHPDKAYADAVAGRAPRSDPAVTNDGHHPRHDRATGRSGDRPRNRPGRSNATPYEGYRDSVYRELKGLIDAPVTPMLKPADTVRTLILPYADRARPDRLYMPRYIFSIVDRPAWVVGSYLVDPLSPASSAPVLGQLRDPAPADDAPSEARP